MTGGDEHTSLLRRSSKNVLLNRPWSKISSEQSLVKYLKLRLANEAEKLLENVIANSKKFGKIL